MMHVKTYLAPSRVDGFGLFSAEAIARGTLVYSPSPRLDTVLSRKSFSELSSVEQEVIRHYGFFNRDTSQWRLAFDDIRFCNHERPGNIGLTAGFLVALQDIEPGTELLQNYGEFENLRSGLE